MNPSEYSDTTSNYENDSGLIKRTVSNLSTISIKEDNKKTKGLF